MPHDTAHSVMTAEFNQHRNNMIGLLQLYAPSGEAQQRVASWAIEVERDCRREQESKTLGDAEVLRALAGAIYDGLSWGNWPWTVHSLR